jgi:hypothetical protein
VVVALICDTGPLYAAADRTDTDHAACSALLRDPGERIVVPAPVLVELDWLFHSRRIPEAMDALLGDVESAAVHVEPLADGDYARVRELCRTYADNALGFVDAALIAVVERLDERKLATLDHRHFTVVRPSHTPTLRLLPE